MPSQKMKGKLALVGDAGVGKTSLIRRFVVDEFDDRYLHTVGTKVTKINLAIPRGVDTEVDLDLSIFDIMGQKGFGDLVRETYFHNVQGLLAVCDVTSRPSLDNLQDWIATALEIAGAVPVYMLVNKSDLGDRASFGREAASKAAEPWDAPLVYTSAKAGENVDEAFNALAVDVVSEAIRALEARSVAIDLEDKILEALSIPGVLGLSRNELYARFRGIAYDDLKDALERLEQQAYVQISWKGPADFSALITPKGEALVRKRSAESSPETLPAAE